MFVCGSRRVADGVEDVMMRMRKEWVPVVEGDGEMESAEEWFAKLKEEQRYMADVFD